MSNPILFDPQKATEMNIVKNPDEKKSLGNQMIRP